MLGDEKGKSMRNVCSVNSEEENRVLRSTCPVQQHRPRKSMPKASGEAAQEENVAPEEGRMLQEQRTNLRTRAPEETGCPSLSDLRGSEFRSRTNVRTLLL